MRACAGFIASGVPPSGVTFAPWGCKGEVSEAGCIRAIVQPGRRLVAAEESGHVVPVANRRWAEDVGHVMMLLWGVAPYRPSFR